MTRLIAVWILILAWGMTLPAALAAPDDLVQAKDFQADARIAAKRQVAILVVFTLPTCSYCERAKREYLVPMHKDPTYHKRVIIREVIVGTTTPLIGFDGMPSTHGAFAAAHQVLIAPTVKMFDSHGAQASVAIVGLLIPDLYFGYLEAAIDEGIRKARGK